MSILENYYKKIIRHDLINKFLYNYIEDVPQLKKIVLNFGCKNSNIRNLGVSLLSLELITGQRGFLTRANRASILLKIRKGDPVGCMVVLKKNKMYTFALKLLTDVFPNLKHHQGILCSMALRASLC